MMNPATATMATDATQAGIINHNQGKLELSEKVGRGGGLVKTVKPK